VDLVFFKIALILYWVFSDTSSFSWVPRGIGRRQDYGSQLGFVSHALSILAQGDLLRFFRWLHRSTCCRSFSWLIVACFLSFSIGFPALSSVDGRP
jgi:hypothetical protein